MPGELLSAVGESGSLLQFEGSHMMRARIVLATLSGRTIKIRRIRSRATNPGITEYEASFIRLIDKITNGSKIEVSETGTALYYHPGILIGGKVEHDCSLERGIGYYLEPLMALGAFCKDPLNASLRGVTNKQNDPSPDLLRQSGIPVLKRFFLIDDGLEIKVQKRGCAPGGGGLVNFRCPIRRVLKPLQVTDQGKVKRIRGVAWATRVSPAVANRLVESAKGMLLKCIPDVFIVTDHLTGNKSGKSPGFGLVLTAETNTGCFLSAEVTSRPASVEGEPRKAPTVPEELGAQGASALFEEIYRGGCVDSTNQSLMILLLALGQRDVSKVVTGPLSDYSIHFLRHMKDFFGMVYKLAEHSEDQEDDLKVGAEKVCLTCVGLGYTNMSKRTT